LNLGKRNRNLSILAATSFLRGATNSAYGVIWQPFVLSLGASMPTLGLLSSLGGMGGIVTTLIQPLGGWFADRLGRRPFLLASSLALLFAYALFILAGLLGVWTLLLVGVVALGASALSRPATSSLTAESVRTERQGSAFSLMLVAGMVPGIIAPAAGGWLADRFGLISVFPVMIALEAATLILVWRYLHETPVAPKPTIPWREAGRALLRSVVPPPGLTGFFCASAADSFFWGMGWGLLYGMLTDTHHFTTEQLGIMSSVMSLSWAVMQMPIGRYLDRRSSKAIMIFSELSGVPLMLIWLTQTRFEIFVVSQVLFALTAATWVPVVNTHLTRSVGAAERAEAFGRLSAFRGLIAFPAPTIGGLLYDWGGMRAPLVANLLGIFLVVAILILFVHEPQRRENDHVSSETDTGAVTGPAG